MYFVMMAQMGGEIKLHGFGSDVHESVHGWLTEAQRRKTFLKKPGGGGGDPNSGGEVKVTRAAAPDDALASGTSHGSMLMTAHPQPPDLDEIVTVDGGHHGLRRTR